jgi:hypothetical protein
MNDLADYECADGDDGPPVLHDIAWVDLDEDGNVIPKPKPAPYVAPPPRPDRFPAPTLHYVPPPPRSHRFPPPTLRRLGCSSPYHYDGRPGVSLEELAYYHYDDAGQQCHEDMRSMGLEPLTPSTGALPHAQLKKKRARGRRVRFTVTDSEGMLLQ